MITDWTPPESLSEAETMRETTVAQIDEIKNQLSIRKHRRGTPGISSEEEGEYFAWRASALWALTNKQQELRKIKRWLKVYWRHQSQAA